ncbi:caspase-2-like protein, partial [Dinothrombium tinctorium]
MDESDRRKIKENIDALVDVLDYASLLPLLQMKRIFTRSMIEAFDGHQHLEHRKFAMLCDLCKRGPNAFEDFIDCLQMTEQTEAIRLLKPEALTPENMQRRCSLFPVRRGMIIYPSCSPFLNDDQNPDRYYKMTSNPRGYALIVNIRSFAYVNIERIGSEMDVKRLARVFRRLHYDVVVK